MINDSLAREYFQDEDPIGKRLVADMTSYFPELTIVGVVADIKMNALDKVTFPEMFWPLAQWPSRDCWLMIRAFENSGALASTVQQQINGLDRDLAVEQVRTMETVIGNSMWRYRFSAILLGLFSVLALLLAAAGIYGVLSYSVSQRMQEMGIRMALGASQGQILSLMLGQGLRLTCFGILLGTVISLLMGHLVANQLYGVRAHDPVTIGLVALFMLGVAFLACYLPARKATKVDPMIALRYE